MAMRVDTQRIAATAGNISELNTRLFNTLEQSRTTIKELSGVWTGAAADATIGAYEQFAAKYFENYRQMLDDYVKFLRLAAGEGYEETEQAATRKADEI